MDNVREVLEKIKHTLTRAQVEVGKKQIENTQNSLDEALELLDPFLAVDTLPIARTHLPPNELTDRIPAELRNSSAGGERAEIGANHERETFKSADCSTRR